MQAWHRSWFVPIGSHHAAVGCRGLVLCVFFPSMASCTYYDYDLDDMRLESSVVRVMTCSISDSVTSLSLCGDSAFAGSPMCLVALREVHRRLGWARVLSQPLEAPRCVPVSVPQCSYDGACPK
eukprot:PhM_4_TR11642/c0_g3_i1/m.68229